MAEDNIEDFQSLCASIGFVVVNWALAEQSLDMCVDTIFTDCAGNTLAKEMPRSFKRKVDFLRECFSKLVALQVYAPEGIALLDRMQALSIKRHELIHGVVTSITLVNGVFPIDKLDYTSQGIIFRQLAFDPKAFPQLAQDLVDLGRDLPIFGKTLAERFQ